MTTKLKFSETGNKAVIEVNTSGECLHCEEYVDIDDKMSVRELLKLAAQIIDGSSFYKDIFDSRIF
jgi:hypothetical protein